jgi:hypothetical protein
MGAVCIDAGSKAGAIGIGIWHGITSVYFRMFLSYHVSWENIMLFFRQICQEETGNAGWAVE